MSRGRLSVDAAVWERFPSYRAAVLYATGLENGPSDDRSRALLASASAAARERFGDARPSSHPHIASWREAFSQFGAKPSRYPCSAEALLARVLGGGDAPDVNRLVDAYNSVSIERVLPIGGEDWDRLAGDATLRLAEGDEPFVVFHGDVDTVEHPRAGEVVWADAEGVTCRRWNWRQCARTRLTEHTRAAYFLLEAIGDHPAEELDAAGQTLTERLLALSPGAQIETHRLSPP
jgi:DNA/RNA-binding domain of Phe-tRNA-synthetase-like protein